MRHARTPARCSGHEHGSGDRGRRRRGARAGDPRQRDDRGAARAGGGPGTGRARRLARRDGAGPSPAARSRGASPRACDRAPRGRRAAGRRRRRRRPGCAARRRRRPGRGRPEGRRPRARVRASASSTASQRRTAAATSSCRAPGRASYSTDAVVTKQPPGKTPSRRWAIQASTIASRRGRPGSARAAGRQTASVKRATAAASTARCSASLSPKRPISPLLLIVEIAGEAADRDALETLDGREVDGGGDGDRAAVGDVGGGAARHAARYTSRTIVLYNSVGLTTRGGRTMRLTWLGWAGAELESGGATVVVDPLRGRRRGVRPAGRPGRRHTVAAGRRRASAGAAVAGLVTHLHRDHADAAALAAALAPGAPVLEPPAGGGGPLEGLALAQAEHELAAAGLERRRVAPWESVDGRAVHAHRAPGVRRRRRSAGRVARRGRRRARAAPRRHDVPRVLVAHGAAPRAVRRRPRPGERRGRRLSPPHAGQPAAGGARPRAGRDRGGAPRRPPRDPDPRRGLRDRRRLRAGRRMRRERFAAAAGEARRAGARSWRRGRRSRSARAAPGDTRRGPASPRRRGTTVTG